jgi:hypothetical protein
VLASPALTSRPTFTGYLWSTEPVPSSINHFYAFDSGGGAANVRRLATGQYAATFGLRAFLPVPTVHVTTYNASANCDVGGLEVQTRRLTVRVSCYSLAGSAQDTTFDLLAGEAGARPRGTLDYATVLAGHVHFPVNSSHRPITVTHLSAGRYQVAFGGPKTSGVAGTVQVTAFGTRGNCVVAGWHGASAGELVDIDCFSPSGSRADSSFFVGYSRRGNLTGIRGAATADAFASRPTTASYRPAVQDNDTTGAHVTVQRAATGQYLVTFVHSGGRYHADGGDVQVSAVATSDRHCYVVSWSTTVSPQAKVSCVDNAGAPADTPFTIQWINDAAPA